jgi:hypothetical protein
MRMDHDRGTGGSGAVPVDIQKVAAAGRPVRQVGDPFHRTAAADQGSTMRPYGRRRETDTAPIARRTAGSARLPRQATRPTLAKVTTAAPMMIGEVRSPWAWARAVAAVSQANTTKGSSFTVRPRRKPSMASGRGRAGGAGAAMSRPR